MRKLKEINRSGSALWLLMEIGEHLTAMLPRLCDLFGCSLPLSRFCFWKTEASFNSIQRWTSGCPVSIFRTYYQSWKVRQAFSEIFPRLKEGVLPWSFSTGFRSCSAKAGVLDFFSQVAGPGQKGCEPNKYWSNSQDSAYRLMIWHTAGYSMNTVPIELAQAAQYCACDCMGSFVEADCKIS